ncbi:MAG: tetratricopeptide repeat protein [Acidobacteria bacterium]|nr:tetratricopeptide repeat protein [Acidobacteriota bacterium]
MSGRPVANLSLAINYALAPVDAREVFEPAGPSSPPGAGDLFVRNIRGYRLGNLVIHLGAALALFGVVRRTLLVSRVRACFTDAAPWVAGAVALIWAVHPLTTAAVTYLVQRVESLMSLFYLLTLYGAIRAWDAAEARPRLWTAVAVVSCACGMATKEVMVSAPLAVALWGYLFGRRDDAGWRVEAGLAATWVILAVLVYGERRGPSLDLASETIWRYLITQSAVIVHYLQLAFVPRPLAFLYDWPLAASLADVIAPAVFVAALLGATVALVVRRHPAAFPAACVFLVLAPSSSVLPIATEVAAEHRMYLPLAAVVAAVVVVAFLLGRRVTARDAGAAPATSRARTLAAVTGAVVLATVLALGLETRARNDVYDSEERLWADNVAARPNDPRPRTAYGSALARRGRLADAEVQLQAAVALAPDDPVALVRLGSVLASQNKVDAAIPHLEHTLRVRPEDVDAHRYLGEIYAMRRQDALAVVHYERVHAAYPDDPMMAARLASILADSRDTSVRNGPRALQIAERAAALTGRREPRVLEILSVAKAATGRLADAEATVREAIPLAQARGDRALVGALEYRASAYAQAAQQGFGPRR